MTSPGDTASRVLAPRDRGRILIVDDERPIRRLFQMILMAELPGHLIESAEDGSVAVEAFQRHHHGLLLMDLRMPVMDGCAAFSAIERACVAWNWEMPSVVFCTGYAPPDAVRRVVETSSDLHALVAKPVSNDTLVNVVRRCLGR
jgi:CheY-like chemotaxis protein